MEGQHIPLVILAVEEREFALSVMQVVE